MENKKFNVLVNFEGKDSITSDEIILVHGDYNSVDLDFQINKEYTLALFYLIKPNGKYYATAIDNKKITIDSTEIFDVVGKYQFGISLFDEDSKLTNTSKGIINVIDNGINITDEDVESDNNFDILDKLIQEVLSLKLVFVDKGQYEDGNIILELSNGDKLTLPVGDLINISGDIAVDLSEYVKKNELPKKLSDLENDSGYITEYNESDPTVPSHVKEITKNDITNWNNKTNFSGSYKDLTDKPTIPAIPTNISAFTNDAGYLTGVPDNYPTTDEMNTAINNSINTSIISALESDY